jgi:guanine deaminase
MLKDTIMNLRFMQISIEIALEGIEKKSHGPFGAVIVRGNDLIGLGTNQVTSTNDPTAHAEINAIRDACKKLNTFSLKGHAIYTSCEPCPMCLGAIYWARLDKIFYGATRSDAARVNFDDHQFYEEIKKPPLKRSIPMTQIMRNECVKIFDAWRENTKKIHY